MSVLDNVTLAPRRICRKTPRPQANEKPCSCCAGWVRRTTYTSTRGNRRAWAAAGGDVRALAMQPKVMLFDEPTQRWTPRWCRRCWT